MTNNGNNRQPLRVAIIGAGPAGFYTAGQLLKQDRFPIEVDLFDRLPTPYGLVRGGVAPDHQRIKAVTKSYEKIAQESGFRFYGFVSFGEDLSLEDLTPHYHQVVFATGSQTGKQLDIPGANLLGSHPASDFVAWYNGHPDYRDLEFDLSHERVAVIGMGNVALDVARILCRTKDELHVTDIADYALEALSQSGIKEVYLLGRRGPAQAAFTPPEIKELGQLTAVDICVPQEDARLDPLSQAELGERQDRAAMKNVEIIQEYASRTSAGKARRMHFRFLASPTEILGQDGRIRGLRLVKNELDRTEVGTLRPRATDRFEEIPVGLVFHSIGYRGVPLPGVPFNERWGTIPNEKGRVTELDSGKVLRGLYTVGWIKRGPSGVIGTNKLDAIETVDAMLEDLQAGVVLDPHCPDADSADLMIRTREPRHIHFRDWLRLDQVEIERGSELDRPRYKFSVIEDMLSTAKKAKSQR